MGGHPRRTFKISSSQKTTVAERLVCSPPTKAIRVQSPVGSLRISACGNRERQCRWSAGFLGDLPFSPPFHSGVAPYSPQSLPSTLPHSTPSCGSDGAEVEFKGGDIRLPGGNPPINRYSCSVSHVFKPRVTSLGIESGSPGREMSIGCSRPPTSNVSDKMDTGRPAEASMSTLHHFPSSAPSRWAASTGNGKRPRSSGPNGFIITVTITTAAAITTIMTAHGRARSRIHCSQAFRNEFRTHSDLNLMLPTNLNSYYLLCQLVLTIRLRLPFLGVLLSHMSDPFMIDLIRSASCLTRECSVGKGAWQREGGRVKRGSRRFSRQFLIVLEGEEAVMVLCLEDNRWNARAGETGDPRENSLTSGIIRPWIETTLCYHVCYIGPREVKAIEQNPITYRTPNEPVQRTPNNTIDRLRRVGITKVCAECSFGATNVYALLDLITRPNAQPLWLPSCHGEACLCSPTPISENNLPQPRPAAHQPNAPREVGCVSYRNYESTGTNFVSDWVLHTAKLSLRAGLPAGVETDLLTNSLCDRQTEDVPRKGRDANPRPLDYRSATPPLSYGGRAATRATNSKDVANSSVPDTYTHLQNKKDYPGGAIEGARKWAQALGIQGDRWRYGREWSDTNVRCSPEEDPSTTCTTEPPDYTTCRVGAVLSCRACRGGRVVLVGATVSCLSRLCDSNISKPTPSLKLHCERGCNKAPTSVAMRAIISWARYCVQGAVVALISPIKGEGGPRALPQEILDFKVECPVRSLKVASSFFPARHLLLTSLLVHVDEVTLGESLQCSGGPAAAKLRVCRRVGAEVLPNTGADKASGRNSEFTVGSTFTQRASWKATAAERLACSPLTKVIRVQSGFSHVGIVPDDAGGRRIFSGISLFPRPFIPALLYTHLNHPHRFSRLRC
ncbi:hypothetical protein PR048_003128 [Dryococelus australis]|uniref:Uncharacterized protein n=1 Tax=Dryococelus australis TaxID=614101 RepID=A0ABQ9IM59_9NEOP|nr:hypothetical protein PR048_003128 [Dryococelus australis]